MATHASLLERLKDLEDQDSWQQFYTTYRRLILSFAVKHGLSDTEAEEVVQETFITVARNIADFRYDPAQCSFKTWLFNLTRWRIQDQVRKRQPDDPSIHRQPSQTNRTATFEDLPGPEGERLAAVWDEEWRKDIVERALDKIRAKVDEKQFQIFDLCALQNWPARKGARSLGVSRALVYVIKFRIKNLLNKETQLLRAGDR